METKEYHFKSSRLDIRYYFDDNYLYKDWKESAEVGTDSCPLDQLTTKFSKALSRPADFTESLNMIIFFLLSSIIIFFSDYHSKIPLLAPVLLVVGIVNLYLIRDEITPRGWTIVHYGNGVEAIHIMHDEKTKEERERFERSLIRAIGQSNGTEIAS